MLRLPQFNFVHARTLAEAASVLSGEGAAEGELVRLVAGGTDLWPNMKRRHQQAATVVSLMGIPGLAGIDVNGEIHIGATTLLSDVVAHPAVRERYPGFAAAVQSISSPPLRNMGTIGGNLCVDTRCTYYNQTEEWRRSIDYCMKAEGDDLLGRHQLAPLLGAHRHRFGADGLRAGRDGEAGLARTASG